MTEYNKWIYDNAVDIGYLSDWYINSVCDTDNPTWTDEHLSELIGDFYCIPKEVVDKLIGDTIDE